MPSRSLTSIGLKGTAVIVGVVLAGSCDAPTKPLDFGPEPVRAFCARYQAEVSDKLSQCFGGSPEYYTAQFNLTWCEPDRLSPRNLLGLDGATASDCMLQLRDWTCDKEIPFSCLGAIRGVGGDGEPCNSDLGCAPGMRCAGAPCEGVCSRAPARGDWAWTCDPARGEDACAGGLTCGALGGDMFFCFLPSGAACDAFQQCRPGESCFDGRCRPVGATGEACVTDSDCAVWARCASNGMAQMVCQLDLGFGDPCNSSLDEECAGGFLICDNESRQCVPLPDAGETCAEGWVCGGDNRCNGDSETCEPLRAPGQECDRDEQCREWNCVRGICSARCAE